MIRGRIFELEADGIACACNTDELVVRRRIQSIKEALSLFVGRIAALVAFPRSRYYLGIALGVGNVIPDCNVAILCCCILKRDAPCSAFHTYSGGRVDNSGVMPVCPVVGFRQGEHQTHVKSTTGAGQRQTPVCRLWRSLAIYFFRMLCLLYCRRRCFLCKRQLPAAVLPVPSVIPY